MYQVLRERWMHFWFAPQQPENLGLCRVLFFGALFWLFLPQDFALLGTVAEVFWSPIWLFRVFHIPLLSEGALDVLQVLWKTSLVLGCVGLWTRASTTTAFVLGFYLLGLPNNLGKTGHHTALLVFVFAILMFSRCGDAWSLDRFIRRRRNPLASPERPSGEYTWPVRMVWLAMALVLFAAGVAKLRHAGLDWIFSDHLSRILVERHYYTADGPLVQWGLSIAQHEGLTRLLAALTVLLEAGYPLALVSRRLRWFLVPGAFLMLVGIRVLMGPRYEAFLICHVFWVPWDRVRHFVGSLLRRRLLSKARV